MASELHPQIDSSLGATLGRTIDLVQQVATDELRMLQLESQDRVGDGMHRAAWIGFGVFCLAFAWLVAWAAAVVALERWLPLEVRIAMLAISQLAIGTVLVGYGLRSRPATP